MLTKEFQEKWATALESDKYKQGSGQLRDRNNNYCCLGVAADLLAPDKWVHSNVDGGAWGMKDGTCEVRSGYLTTELREQIGLEAADETRLVGLNDDLIMMVMKEGDFVHVNDFPAIAKHVRTLPTRD